MVKWCWTSHSFACETSDSFCISCIRLASFEMSDAAHLFSLCALIIKQNICNQRKKVIGIEYVWFKCMCTHLLKAAMNNGDITHRSMHCHHKFKSSSSLRSVWLFISKLLDLMMRNYNVKNRWARLVNIETLQIKAIKKVLSWADIDICSCFLQSKSSLWNLKPYS